MGNNAFAAVLGISTCKLELRGGRTLYLHDVLYAPEVQRNLVSVLVLLKLGFSIMFENGCVKILLDNVYYGSGYLLNGCHNGFPLRLGKTTKNQMESPPIFSIRV